MKKIFKAIIKLLMRLFYPKFNNPEYYTLYYLQLAVIQKVFGINREAAWPMHFTSQVKAANKIQWGTKAPGSGMGCYIDGRNGIIIEENVWIGPRVSIISKNHHPDNYYKYMDDPPIRIGKNSLLTTNCVILPGVELGEHTIVAAGAVVTKSFPEGNQVLAGNPAKVLKKLDNYETVK